MQLPRQPVGIDDVLGPQPPSQFDELVEDRPRPTTALPIDPIGGIVARRTESETDVEAPAAQPVEGGESLGRGHRPSRGTDQHGDAETDTTGEGSEVTQDAEWLGRRRPPQLLVERPDGIDAGYFEVLDPALCRQADSRASAWEGGGEAAYGR